MTKQEEIREGLYKLARKERMVCVYGEFVKDALTYLHSQGVVIKGRMLAFEMEPVGYEVEPLIKEK